MTEAEAVKHLFETAERTVSIVELARKRSATRHAARDDRDGRNWTYYQFSDGSCLAASGRGVNHQLRVI